MPPVLFWVRGRPFSVDRSPYPVLRDGGCCRRLAAPACLGRRRTPLLLLDSCGGGAAEAMKRVLAGVRGPRVCLTGQWRRCVDSCDLGGHVLRWGGVVRQGERS